MVHAAGRTRGSPRKPARRVPSGQHSARGGFTQMLTRRLFVSALLTASALVVAGPAVAQDKALTIASSMPALEFPFFVHMQSAIRDESNKLGGITLVETDGQNQATK